MVIPGFKDEGTNAPGRPDMKGSSLGSYPSRSDTQADQGRHEPGSLEEGASEPGLWEAGTCQGRW